MPQADMNSILFWLSPLFHLLFNWQLCRSFQLTGSGGLRLVSFGNVEFSKFYTHHRQPKLWGDLMIMLTSRGFHTLSSRLGIRETIYHLFHYASLHSAEDKWSNNNCSEIFVCFCSGASILFMVVFGETAIRCCLKETSSVTPQRNSVTWIFTNITLANQTNPHKNSNLKGQCWWILIWCHNRLNAESWMCKIILIACVL